MRGPTGIFWANLTPFSLQDQTGSIYMNFYCHGRLKGTSTVQVDVTIGDIPGVRGGVVNTYFVSKSCSDTCRGDYFEPDGWAPTAGQVCPYEL
jgi:hypothetical protein